VKDLVAPLQLHRLPPAAASHTASARRGSPNPVLPLAAVMLQCARHPQRGVVEHTVAFFLHLNTLAHSP
jgi:hypothetical protein